MSAVRVAFLTVVVGSVVALSACAAPSAATPPSPPTSTPPATSAPASEAPASEAAASEIPAPAEPEAPAVDPADMSTWIAGSAGIGPIARGASWATVQGELTAFTIEQMCPSAFMITADGSATAYAGLEADGDTIGQAWVFGGGDLATPATAAGIRVGATLADLQAAYPGIAESTMPYPTGFTAYATSDADGEWIVFALSDGVVKQIGSRSLPTAPKELCG